MDRAEKKARVQAQFGAHARFYTTSVVHAQGHSLSRLVVLAAPQPHDTVVDIATAAGHNAFSFAPHVRYVIGLDLTPEMLPQARALAQQRNIRNIDFSQGDAECLPFADHSFSIVTCRIAPHHFPDIEAALQEMVRICQPHGRLAICDNVTPEDPDAAAYINALEARRDPSHHWAYSLTEWRQFLHQAGLVIEAEETLPKKMHFASWALRMSVPEAVTQALRQELFHAPPLARDYLNPRIEADGLCFDLTEGIFIGRKS
jgi:ubiquinone/menaquinone biosynthesis C-methylase UbiE